MTINGWHATCRWFTRVLLMTCRLKTAFAVTALACLIAGTGLSQSSPIPTPVLPKAAVLVGTFPICCLELFSGMFEQNPHFHKSECFPRRPSLRTKKGVGNTIAIPVVLISRNLVPGLGDPEVDPPRAIEFGIIMWFCVLIPSLNINYYLVMELARKTT